MTSEPTVFVVDDDPTVRKTICALVESVDLETQAYTTAQEFLEAFDPACPACLVLDTRLPGMSGLELLEHLREKGATIPVIMMSGDADAALRARAVKAGAFDFLDKSTVLRFKEVLLHRIWQALFSDLEK